ncbi:YwhD family protein [Neobacillus sp. OS1-32]|uniref:YwhD family protein n=1 Tax=Neobacillus paridis TaxID=2803862 RepID=A0ABS1TPE9_9BACI|nr:MULTISPECIES: YwhD family protein [Neobacillus]MBL4953180.1 YwhD family protein [Neobacillus paridis]WML29732.1 YwhD family protein [Neobacillus sp. OS1-32]
MEENKKKMGFNIIKSDPTDGHKGFGKGALSLDNVTPVIIDVEAGEAEIDIGAMHARSAVERGIKFLPNKEEVPNGKPYWLVWVTVDRKEEGPYYAGVAACFMTVDREIRRGYKLLPEHVNRMDKSLKRHIIVDDMDARSKEVLADFLRSHNETMWNNSSAELKTALAAE